MNDKLSTPVGGQFMRGTEKHRRIRKQLPAMSRAEWEALPPIVKVFLPWSEARTAKVIELPSPEELEEAVRYFCKSIVSEPSCGDGNFKK